MGVRRKDRSRSRLFWASVTIAPWCLAAGLLVSFVADAGQEVPIGASRLDLTDLAAGAPADLVPSSDPFAEPGFPLPDRNGLIREARLFVGEGPDLAPGPDEVEPKIVLKASRTDFPVVDRAHKSDPALALRPTFDSRLRHAGSAARYRLEAIAFGADDAYAGDAVFAATDAELAYADASRLQPLPEGITVASAALASATSPLPATGEITPLDPEGATPSVARAVSLASITPAGFDAMPVEIAALPKFSRGPKGIVRSNAPVVGIVPDHPDYAALIDGTKAESEQRCLAEAVYFEARSEPEEGQAAVAQVVMNRVMSGLYPASVCAVVFQNHQRRNACQFSFACEGHALRITETESWTNAVRIAREVTEGSTYVSDVGGATHYHADYVRPTWARQLTKMDVIGRHIFYKLKTGHI